MNPKLSTESKTEVGKKSSVAGKRGGRPKYSGSRWAGIILLIITFMISLFFYARSGAADFFSALFGPAKYTIVK